MIVVELAVLLIIAAATWLVLNRPHTGAGVLHRRLTTTLLAAAGVVVAGGIAAGIVHVL